MKKLSLLFVTLFAGCMSGPNYLSNSVRDARNKSYVESPVGTALITDVLPVYPLVELFASVPDVLIINPIQFWGFDVWSEQGTGYRHDNPMMEDPSWFESMVSQADAPEVGVPSPVSTKPVAVPASASK